MYQGRVRSIPTIILLSLFTCGIYPLIWYYEVSTELQDALGKGDTTPGMEVLLMVFTCGLYTIFWWYKYGRLVSELQASRGLPVHDNATMLCVLSGLSPYVAWGDLIGMCIMQSDLNSIWEPVPWRP
ncbi:MAG TPA: DUF4234 domain-containing protein [Armatimonadota bacterium]|jgi:hypothetical protein